MPMDHVQQSPPSENWSFKRRRICVEEKRSLVPRRCFLSDKKLWFKKCVVVTSMITGPGDPVIDSFWCDRHEFLLSELKG